MGALTLGSEMVSRGNKPLSGVGKEKPKLKQAGARGGRWGQGSSLTSSETSGLLRYKGHSRPLRGRELVGSMLHAHGPTLRGRPGREGSLCPSSTSRLVAGPCLSVGGQRRLWPGLCSLPCPLTVTLHLSSRKASKFRRTSSLLRKAMPVSRLAQSRAGTAQA